ncbi:hypothetical protein vBKpnAMK6_00319 [Klebsiella phage vB_Kpn_AM_K6]
MNLNVILPIKKIVINEKTISIPKLGLKHHNLMKDVKGPDENMNLLLDSICPGLTAAESDIVVLHLLAFFVTKWADDLVNTIAIDGPEGPIKGMLNVMEIFE